MNLYDFFLIPVVVIVVVNELSVMFTDHKYCFPIAQFKTLVAFSEHFFNARYCSILLRDGELSQFDGVLPYYNCGTFLLSTTKTSWLTIVCQYEPLDKHICITSLLTFYSLPG